MTNTIYIHQPEKSVSFTRLPNFLFEALTFTPLSNEAKILYAFILRRTELSRKNGWADEYGRIFLYCPICEVVALLHCGRQKAINTLRELKYAGLVEIQKQGCGKPNRHLPKILWSGSKHRLQEIRLWNAGGLKTVPMKYGNHSPEVRKPDGI